MSGSNRVSGAQKVAYRARLTGVIACGNAGCLRGLTGNATATTNGGKGV